MDDLDQYMFGRVPMRAWDLVYAALGPAGTAYLVSELESAGHYDGAASELRSRLGRAPDMLMLLGVAMGVVRDRFHAESRGEYPRTRHIGDVHKLLGWQVVEAMEAFGLSENSMRDYLRRGWRYYGSGDWPPSVVTDEPSDSEGPDEAPRPPRPQSGRAGVAAHSEMAATLARAGLQVPALPGRSVRDLRADPWEWSTTTQFSALDAYSDADMVLADLLSPRDNFFLFAHCGHGINSYGLGLLARWGKVVVAQQTAFGGAFNDHDREVRRTNAATASWSRLVVDLEQLDGGHLPSGRPEVAVVFSDYRGQAFLLQRDETASEHRHQGLGVPDGWRVTAGQSRYEDDNGGLEALAELARGSGHVAASAAHLDRLVTGAGF